MIVKIGNKQFDYFVGLNMSRRYDAVCSDFSLDIYFNPDNEGHKLLTKPCSYQKVTIEENGKLLLTGVLLNNGYKSSPVPELTTLNGYSLPGVLEDCEIPKDAYPLQNNGLSLKNITERIIKHFGIKLLVDSAVQSKVNEKYNTVKASDQQKVKEYICELAAQKHVMVSHDENGNLLFTEVKSTSKPIYHITDTTPNTLFPSITLDVNAQDMHSSITVHKQASTASPNAGSATVKNPYVTAYRPRVVRQSSGSEVDTKLAARNILSEELKNIKLTIEMVGWELNGSLIAPNQIISVTDPSLYLYNKTYFFIEQVDYRRSASETGATLHCYLPEVYNSETPKNIFA